MSILTIKDVSYSYGRKQALCNFNLTIEPGQIVGLLGPNGSGKTTLIKIINTLIARYKGEVQICGTKPSTSTKELVSYLPDTPSFRMDQKIITQINMHADYYKSFDKIKALEMLQVVSLDENATIKQLSKGMQEKLQLVLAMSRDAKLYIFDEPFAGVDPAARDFIFDTIFKNYSEGSSMLFSTHLISEIENVIDRVIFIKNGEKILDQDSEELRTSRNQSIDSIFREEFKC